ncbi:hypothetical protein BGZ72_001641 [Mortierella alpina]|nr:hypothetical protein BGZ72_001641 [Mortierella alpina]
MVPSQTATLYTRTGALISPPDGATNAPSTTLIDHQQQRKQLKRPFPEPSLLTRYYLKGILHKPQDIAFLARVFARGVWAMVRLHGFELPFLILTRFKYSTEQYPLDWPWWWTIFMGLVRIVAPEIRTVGQLRFVGLVIERAVPLQMLYTRNVKVSKNVQFKVNLDILLRPERATLASVRGRLLEQGCDLDDCVLNPTQAYLDSMHPPSLGAQAQLANLPEEVGTLDSTGSYILEGEWIEATPKKNETRPLSTTVILYFHGGGHGFGSPASHRKFVADFAKDVGPGTRVFSVNYRLAPEHPFPAAIHDAFAAYLYLTEPQHEALSLGKKASFSHRLPVNPRDIVVAGDSAGANLAAAFMLYMTRYVQPATTPKYVLPHAMLLISAWVDPTSSLPSASSSDSYCYIPGPMGINPFDKEAFMNVKQLLLAYNYICGDAATVPNARNALGKEREWEWYSHLAQHPLVAPVHRADLSELTNTLIQTGTLDRLIDENRLFANRLGMDNPSKLVRIEVYKGMVHVHHVFSILEAAQIASKKLARFIERSRAYRDAAEDVSATIQRHYVTLENDHRNAGMVQHKSKDGVEWVTVAEGGKEEARDEGWPLALLAKTWPANELKEA